MTRHAQVAQFPTLVRLHEGQAMFRDGEQLTITMTAEAWKAMGRPVDLQVVATPIDSRTASAPYRGVPTDEDVEVALESRAEAARAEYLAQDPEAREGLEAGL